jgi:hypothetical protein
VDQLTDTLGAAGLTLSAEDIERLDRASRIPLGFPFEMLAEDARTAKLAGGIPERVEVPRGLVS